MTPNIVIYSGPNCVYCDIAVSLLNRKGLSYEVIDISESDALLNEMIVKSGGRQTIPQIFINDIHIGGCDDLYALERAGKLSKLLEK